MTVEIGASDHISCYPGAGRLLGMQMIGQYGAAVSKRVDLAAIAVFHGATVDALSDYDRSYTPPLSSPWDQGQQVAQAWVALKSLG